MDKWAVLPRTVLWNVSMHDEGVSHESCDYVWSASAIGCAIHDMDFAVKVRWIFVQPPGKEQGFTVNHPAQLSTSDASRERVETKN